MTKCLAKLTPALQGAAPRTRMSVTGALGTLSLSSTAAPALVMTRSETGWASKLGSSGGGCAGIAFPRGALGFGDGSPECPDAAKGCAGVELGGAGAFADNATAAAD